MSVDGSLFLKALGNVKEKSEFLSETYHSGDYCQKLVEALRKLKEEARRLLTTRSMGNCLDFAGSNASLIDLINKNGIPQVAAFASQYGKETIYAHKSQVEVVAALEQIFDKANEIAACLNEQKEANS